MWVNKRRERKNKAKDNESAASKAIYTDEEFAELLKYESLSYLSFDERIPWTEELIARYENRWDWGNLSLNRSLPWSEKLIDKYLDRWDFGTMNEDEHGEKSYTVGSSWNSGLPWSLNLIKKYESRWDWISLTYSENIPWSLDILKEFEERWVWDQIIWNATMWKKVFYPYFDEEVLEALLILLKKTP
jgi:hypothetical protein